MQNKIKNKRIFVIGTAWLLMGIGLLIMMILSKDLDLKSIALSVLGFLVGIMYLISSFDEKSSKELMNDMDDERDKFIEYKSKSITLLVMDILIFISMIILGLMYKFNTADRNILIPVITSLLFVYLMQLLSYAITYIIISKKS